MKGSRRNNSAFIEAQKIVYKSLVPVFCPALQHYVYFNADGMHHLLYTRRRPRSYAERLYRLSLVPYISQIISSAHYVIEELVTHVEPVTTLWSLEYSIPNEGHFTVVLCRVGNRRIHFLSVMKRKNKKT
jgi:hypothetical protein